MRRSNRRDFLQHSTGILLLLASCARGEDAATTKPARPGAPASLQEAARVIDLRTFPMLEHGEVFHQTAVKVGYALAKPDLMKDVQFYRGKLADAGWKIESDQVDPEKHYGILRGTKQGFFINVSIVKDPNDGKMQVFVENQGNIDTRSLPRFGGAELTQSLPDISYYRTDGKLDAVTEFVRTEMKKLGWLAVVGPGGATAGEPGVREYLRFIQRGMTLNAHIELEDGKVEGSYHVHLLQLEPPIMPDVIGTPEFMEPPPFLHVLYATKFPPDKVLEFYRKELPNVGWSMAAETGKGKEDAIKVALKGPDQEPLRLELHAQNGITLVLVASEGMGG